MTSDRSILNLHPTPEELRALRQAAGISHSKAAALVHLGHGKRWHEYENGTRNIDKARFELFLIKTRQHPAIKPT
jgi:Helix-turn-helix domain